MAQITSGSLTIVDVTDGAAGLNNTTVFLYQRATSAPDKPTGDLTYTFATASITGALEGWTQSIDDLSGSDPIWMIAAVASSNGKTDIIESSEWAGPIKMAQNGQDGQPGTPGTPGTPGANGLNQATIFIYKRDDSATAPSKTTYTFATGDFITPSGWSKTIPTEPKGKPCWVTSAIAIGAEATAELNWATPSVLVEDGSNGKNGISPVVTATENGVKIVDSEGNETYITNGANGTSYYTFVRYSKNANGSGYVATPTSETIYIGVYSGTKSSPPAYNDSGWTWSKYVGPRGVQGVSVVSTRELYYLKTNSTDPTQITSADQIHTTDDVNQWTSVVPTYIGSGKYYTCIETKLDNGTVWGAPIENKGLTDANANATQAIEIAKGVRQHFFWLPEDVSTNVPSGAYIAEENEETFKAGPTKGNVLTRSDGIWIRNGVDKLATLQGSGLTLLVPTGTYKGQKSVSLNGTGLTFYNIGSSNSAAATLASDGLQITNGSVILGTTDGIAAGNVTLSNKNFTRSINGTSHNDLRFAIGSKFGVASDGTLYSSGLDSVASRVDKTEAHLIGMYATSSTTSGTAAKVATITPAIPSGTNWELSTGTTITVKFTNANTTASPTLNVNSKGAKPIKTYANGNLTEAEYKWAAGSTFTFTYNGTNWLMQDSTTSVRMNSAETSISNNADAITLRATKTEAYQLAQPNLSPWFSYSPYKVNDYWTTSSFNSLFTYTDMGDGWVRVQCTNNTSAVVRSDPRPIRCESVQPNSDYTFLYEVRNNHSTIGSTTDSNIYVVQNNNSQFWGENCKKNLEGDRSDTYIVIKNLPQDSSTPYIKRFVKTSEPEDSSHWTGTVGGLGAIVQRCAAGDTIDYELRISIYEGEYTGPYKPYSGTQLYASEAELKITNDNVLIKATKGDTTNAQGGQHLIQSLINVAPEGVKIAANKIEIDGSAIFSAISNDVNAAVSNVMTTGLGMKVNYSGFATASDGECYFHGYNNQNEEADINGWVIWNGEKLTITKGMWINPNGAVPVNTPIFHVFRTSASPYHSDVWWDSSLLTWRGYAYTADKVPGTKANWTWNEATDCILAVYVATGNEAISSAQLFTTPKKFSELPNPSDIHSIVDTSIDAIEIGGKNLLRASEKLNQAWTADQTTIDTSTGIATLTRTGSGNCRIYQMPANGWWTWEAGVEYTASVEAKASENGVVLSFDCNSSGTITYDSNRRLSLTTEWKRYSCTFTIIGTVSTGSMTYSMATTTTGKTIYLRKPMLELGNKATQWAPAPEDIKTAAVSEEQYIYISKASGTSSVPVNNTWVTETGDKQDTWTTKRPTYNSSYPVLFVAKQKKVVSGTVTCTTPLKDDTTTIIDGGHITTGTIDASKVTVTNIDANNISANLLSAIQAKVSTLSTITANMGTLTAGTISYGTTGNNNSFYLSANSSKTATIAGASRSSLRLTVGSGFGVDVNGKVYATGVDITGAIKAQSLTIESNTTINDTSGLIRNDAIKVGGTNMLGNTSNLSGTTIISNIIAGATFGNIGNYNDAVSSYSFEDFDGHSNSIKWTSTGTGNRGVTWYTKVGAVKASTEYTFSCKVKSTVATTVHTHTAWRNGSATSGYTGWTSEGSVSIAANTWTDYSYTFKPNSNAKLDWEFLVALCFTGVSSGATFYVAHAKLEKGNKATDWSPAPEDEVNARKFLIREVTSGNTHGIEVGYEDGGYKALINAGGSFDVITASGETVATFSEESTMRSVRTETWDVNGVESEVEVEAWQQLTPDGTQFYKRERSIDEDFSYDKSQSTIIDAYGIRPQGSGAIFTLGANVRAPNETRLWHMKTGNGSYMIEGAWFGAGYITAQKKKVAFTIPLAIPVVEGASVSCYMMDATMRQGGKYIFGDPDSTKDISPSYVTVSTCPSGLNISIDFPSALTNATNNDVVGIVCNYHISVGSL